MAEHIESIRGNSVLAHRAVLLLVSLFAGGSIHAAQPFSGLPELAAREAITRHARELYRDGKLQEIDALSSEYVAQSTRTPSGLWVSGLLLLGLKGALLGTEPGSTEGWDRLEQQTLEWAKAHPDSSVARLMHAEVIVSRGWQIRGNSYAGEVAESAWTPFREHLARARRYLEEQKPVASRNPNYYTLRLTIEKGLGDDEKQAEAIFDEGTHRFPGYYPLHFGMLDYLLPKWHGSAGQIEKFASNAATRTRDVEGDGMYARIYWYAAQSDYQDQLFMTSFARWDRMRSGFEDVVARYPDQWNFQNFAHFACQAGDEETLRKLLDRVQRPVIAAAWAGSNSFEECERLAGRITL